MQGLIVLLFKVSNKEKLGNQWPIPLLNMPYKIFVKVLQPCLQPIRMDVIERDKTTVLSLMYILENVFLIYEMIDQAKHSKHDMIFFIQNFDNLYDKVSSWDFLFLVRENLQMMRFFVAIVKLFFQDSLIVHLSQWQYYTIIQNQKRSEARVHVSPLSLIEN